MSCLSQREGVEKHVSNLMNNNSYITPIKNITPLTSTQQRNESRYESYRKRNELTNN